MAGLVEKQQSKGALSPQAMEAKMHLRPEQRQQLRRIVTAGLKVMFAEQSHKLAMQQLQGPGPIELKLGKAIAGLLALLWQESKQSLPPQLMIPAGMVLIAHAAEFLADAGAPVTPEQVGGAIEALINEMLTAAKMNPDKVAAMGERGLAGQNAKPAEEGAEPPLPVAEEPAPEEAPAEEPTEEDEEE